MASSILKFEVIGPPRRLWTPVRRPGCIPSRWAWHIHLSH